MHVYDTLSEALTGLRQRGYTYDFNLKHNQLECPAVQKLFAPDSFEVDEVHRFEGNTDPEDESVLYAIRTPDGLHGTLVGAFGTYADEMSAEMSAKLHFRRNV